MPELPEVETVRRGLEPVLTASPIVRVEQRRPDLRFPFPERFADRLAGQSVLSLGRRAKYLTARLAGGDVLLMHLGMSGRFTVEAPMRPAAASLGQYVYGSQADAKHDHVVIHMKDGARVTYNDPRRFGFMLLIPEAEFEQHPLIAGLGVEPLGNELSAAYLATRARGRTVDLKAFLMDQRTIAGLGNIYVSEALHRAGLSPNRGAASLALKSGAPSPRAERLVPAIRAVLQDALVAGGSSLRDYRKADGSSGTFQDTFAVYDREGAPCPTPGCRGTIKRIVQSGRATYYCGVCQK
jgi:formamidopyrimidine-DNA glycosylase